MLLNEILFDVLLIMACPFVGFIVYILLLPGLAIVYRLVNGKSVWVEDETKGNEN